MSARRYDATPLPVSRDTPDHTLPAFSAHPERVLDPAARGDVRVRADAGGGRRAVVERLRDDLASGRWDERHGHRRSRAAYDAGMRLVVS